MQIKETINNRGFTLVELLIGLFLLIIVLNIGYLFHHFTVQSFKYGERQSNTQQVISQASSYITRDIRFATSLSIIDPDLVPSTDITNSYNYIRVNADGVIEHRSKKGVVYVAEGIKDNIKLDLNFEYITGNKTLNFVVSDIANRFSIDSRVLLLNLKDNFTPGSGKAIKYIKPAELGTLTIDSQELPSGTTGKPYEHNIRAIGGTSGYKFTSDSLPSWLFLDESGLLHGTPENAGISSFTITVTDSAGATDSSSFSITINNAAPEAFDVRITPGGNVLNGVYQYRDADYDVEGISIFQWYRGIFSDGRDIISIDGAVSKSYTLSSADENYWVFFQVIPVSLSGVSPGLPVLSEPFFYSVASIVPVTGIIVRSEGNISSISKKNTLQMYADILPENATTKTVKWSVESIGTKKTLAFISNDGLLKTRLAGTIEVKATANDGSGKVGTKRITIN